MINHTTLDNLYSEELYLVNPRNKILLSTPWNELSREEKEQLVKITEALRQRINPKLGLDSFEVVVAKVPDPGQWPDRPNRLIYFGPVINGLPSYEVIEQGGVKMVLAETLSSLIASEPSRSKLWTALKQLFLE